MVYCLFFSWHQFAEDMTVSVISPNSIGPSLAIFGRFPPRPGPLGLIVEMGQGTQILWPHNSPSKSCCLEPRTGRRVLTFLGLHHGRLSFAFLRVPEFLRLSMARFWRFGVRGASPLMLPFRG